jgi:hypothetical protein
MAESKAKSGTPLTNFRRGLESFCVGEVMPLHPMWVVGSN